MSQLRLGPMAVVLLAGCAGQASTVEKSGFLSDYSRLEEGVENEALLYWAKPGVDLSAYHSIVVDPITIRASHQGAFAEVPRKELHRLAKLFHEAVTRELGAVRQIVADPGPGTIRLRLALTEALGGQKENEIATTIHPVGWLADIGAVMATGTRLWVSKVSVEAELSDSATREVLVEAVDRRQGDDSVSSGEWDQVEESLRFWAAAMRRKLDELSAPAAARGRG